MFRSYTEKVYRPNLQKQPPQPSKEQYYHCDICISNGYNANHWRSETDVELHRKQEHFTFLYSQMKKYRNRFCTVCMTLKDSYEDLSSHIKQRHLYSSPQARRIEREIFVCNDCHRVFFNKNILELHILYFHLWKKKERVQKTFVCPKCRKDCKLRSLWYHMQSHDIPTPSICDICLVIFPNVQDLSDHIRSHPMHYSCEICKYHTSKETIFDSHLDWHAKASFDMNHSNLRRYLRKAFVKPTRPSLQFKYNMHHLIKGMLLPADMHVCMLCREICGNRAEMSTHIARDHLSTPAPKQKPSVRCLCGQDFPSKVLLRHHAFKTEGEHGEIEDNPTSSQNIQFANKPTSSQNLRLPATINTEQNDQVEIITQEWEIEPEAEIEFDLPNTEVPTEETSTQEMSYVYTTVDDDVQEFVIIDDGNEEIISF